MGSRFWSVFGSVIGAVLVVVAIWAVIWGVIKSPGVVGSLATAAAAIIAVVVQRDRENKREVQQRHREQVAPMYESLFERFYEGIDAEDPEVVTFMQQFQRKLVFYGSGSVVTAWLKSLKFLVSHSDDDDNLDTTDPRILLNYEDVLLAVRKDLGHDNEGLERGDLIRLFVPDFDAHLAAWILKHGGLEPQPSLEDGGLGTTTTP